MTPRTLIRVSLVMCVIGGLGAIGIVPWILGKEGGRSLVANLIGRPEIPFYGSDWLLPAIEGRDAKRTQVPIGLEKIADGFVLPTDLQFVPGMPRVMVVAGKRGRCEWVDLAHRTRGLLFDLHVPAGGEMGLLGLAFHPRFHDNGLLYVHHNTQHGQVYGTRISEWKVTRTASGDLGAAQEQRVLLEVEQPYRNHKGGQIAFGPDGFLYIGLGDGGDGGDPHGHGQNLNSWLGKILRIDVDRRDPGRPYAIPKDNPFLNAAEAKFEVWVFGVRNPWRFTFVNRQLVIADVGQNKWEEISLAERGDNLGWNQREADTCFKAPSDGAPCDNPRMREPFYVYGRDDGQSITGGLVYTAAAIPALQGQYIFGDAVRYKLWALTLPKRHGERIAADDALALGHFPIMPVAFARDERGEVYVADFEHGSVYRIAPLPRDLQDGSP